MFPQSIEASGSNGTTVTRLLVTGHASMEDLWTVFSSFGEISSIVLVDGGAKVTFLHDETLSKFYQSGEIRFGKQRVLVTKIKERGDQENLSIMFRPPIVQTNWSFTGATPSPSPSPSPAPLTFINSELLPPFSPQYGASILRSPQPTPPPQQQPEIFTFDSSSFLATEPVGQVPREDHFLQPLTPLNTPGPLSSLPHPPELRQINSFYFSPSLTPTPSSSDSSDTIRPPVFSSPYKKFVKFKGPPRHPEFPLRNTWPHSRYVDYTGATADGEMESNIPGSFSQNQPLLMSPRSSGVKVPSQIKSDPDILQRRLTGLSLK